MIRTRTTAEKDGVRQTARRAPVIRSEGVRIPAHAQLRTESVPIRPFPESYNSCSAHHSDDRCCVEEETCSSPRHVGCCEDPYCEYQSDLALAKGSPQGCKSYNKRKDEDNRSETAKYVTTVRCVCFCNCSENLGLGESNHYQ